MNIYGAIEAGGTKIICGIGGGPGNLTASQSIPTTTPRETLGRVAEFFAGRKLKRVGIACFGPLEIGKGRIAAFTPKIEWRKFPIAAAVEKIVHCPVVLDTDVNGAALGEHFAGAARDSKHFVYVTVGTGIGGGLMIGGRLVHGLMHPEIGHMRVRRLSGDSYEGCCPSHADCLEGLANGPAIAQRYGVGKAEDLPDDHPAWPLTAHYLGQMIVNLACAYSPEKAVLGGGIGLRNSMVEMVRHFAAQEMNGYAPLPKIVRAKLGPQAGLLGALCLASQEGLASQK